LLPCTKKASASAKDGDARRKPRRLLQTSVPRKPTRLTLLFLLPPPSFKHNSQASRNYKRLPQRLRSGFSTRRARTCRTHPGLCGCTRQNEPHTRTVKCVRADTLRPPSFSFLVKLPSRLPPSCKDRQCQRLRSARARTYQHVLHASNTHTQTYAHPAFRHERRQCEAHRDATATPVPATHTHIH
jgi:hypothetical protein